MRILTSISFTLIVSLLLLPINSHSSITPQHTNTHHLFFIDSHVEDYETLVSELPSGSEWFLLSSEQDGIMQMQSVLSDYSNLDSIQIISHGSPGTLYLGAAILNHQNILRYSNVLQQIGQSLTENGDILLYGCSIGQGNVGTQFISEFSHYTRADVTASTDLTGNNGLGGNWRLEVSVGVIEVSSATMPYYVHVLEDNTAPTFIVSDGKVINPFYFIAGSVHSVSLQSDGKILVAGRYVKQGVDVDFALTRYNINGTLDATFNTDGMVTYDLGSSRDYAHAVVEQTDGKILIAGYSDSYYFVIIRFDSNGYIDSTFGIDGVARELQLYPSGTSSLALQDDGKILMAGTIQRYVDGNQITSMTMMRFNQDGSLDSDFGADGIVIYNSPDSIFDTAVEIIVQHDEKIIVVGSTKTNNGNATLLVRFNPNGSIDTTYADGGLAILSTLSTSVSRVKVIHSCAPFPCTSSLPDL